MRSSGSFAVSNGSLRSLPGNCRAKKGAPSRPSDKRFGNNVPLSAQRLQTAFSALSRRCPSTVRYSCAAASSFSAFSRFMTSFSPRPK